MEDPIELQSPQETGHTERSSVERRDADAIRLRYPAGVPDPETLRVLLEFGASGRARHIVLRDLAAADFVTNRESGGQP